MAEKNDGNTFDAFFALQDKEVLHALAGLGLMFAGASLIMSHPDVRRSVNELLAATFPQLQGKDPLEAGLAAFLPDVERYIKLRSM